VKITERLSDEDMEIVSETSSEDPSPNDTSCFAR
jgi:hypothetical protein